MHYSIEKYSADMEKIWDEFVMEKSVNGTFMQTRNFINYHPQDRFIDCSILIYDGRKLIAVCPGCSIIENGQKIFFSHKGATFGGLVINPQYYYSEKLLEIINTFNFFLVQEGFKKCILKITPDLFSNVSGSLLEYCLQNSGYISYKELSSYVDLEKITSDVTEHFDRNKKRNIEKCKMYNLEFKTLEQDSEIRDFYALLTINLQKYNLHPIHTLEDILDFKNNRLKDIVKFYGLYQQDIQMAGGMLFCYEQNNVIHAQNLSADYSFKEYSPITYLYYKVIEQAKKEGYSKLSWGISTEQKGKILNLSLIHNKESYGSEYSLNSTFEKTFEEV